MTNISIGKKTLATATLISGVAGFNSANRCKPSVCRNTKSQTLNMKRPKTLLLAWLLALLCLASTGLARAEQVSIGDPETTSNSIYIPWYSHYDYSYTQQIYTAEEIGRAGVINSLTVWLYHGGNSNNEPLPTFNIDIYLKEVDKNAFSGTTDWVYVSSTDKVYTGTLTVANTTARAFTFTFDKSFTYSGQGNLLIAFDDNTGSYKYGLRGLVFSGSSDPNRTIYAFRDGTDYNPTSMSGVTANNTTYQRNVIELGMYDENLSYNQSITIGDLATASNSPRFPWHSNFDYSFTQQIYTAEEIGTSGTINAVTMWLYHSGSEPLPTFNIDIYMKEVDKETFSGSNDWVSVSADDKVYCGSVKVTNTNAQAFTFTLATPFEYSGQGNLLIAFDDNTGSYKYGMNGMVFGESNDPIRAVYCFRDGSDYDPFNMTGITSTTLAQRNVVALSMTDCPMPEGQTNVTIGNLETATAKGGLPWNSAWNYSYTQQIYTAEEIGTAGTINTVTLWMVYEYIDPLPTFSIDIYMKEVDKSGFSGTTDWVSVSASDKVYSSMVTVTNRNVQSFTFTLDTPFEYSGQGNLLIAFDDNTGSWKSGLKGMVFGTADDPNRAIYAFRDNSDYDPLNMGGITANATTYQRNVVELGIDIPCAAPTDLAIDTLGATFATLSWTENGEATAWNLDVNGTVTTITENPYTITGLELSTTYEVKVQADCGDDTSGWTNPVSFTTNPCENMCALTFIVTDSYGDGWNDNAIQVKDVLTGDIIATIANQNLDGIGGLEAQTIALNVCDGQELEFSWVSGSDVSEVSYTVTDIVGDVIVEGSGSGFDTFNYTVSCTATDCRRPTAFAASEIGPRSVVLSWTENGPATEWEIAYMSENDTVFNYVTATTNPYTLTGLAPETQYAAQVTPVCEVDKPSIEISWTTTEACPKPYDVDITPYPYTANVEWSGWGETYDIQWAEPAPTSSAWLRYDDGVVYSLSSEGTHNPSQLTWGVMYPADSLHDNLLTRIAFYEDDYYYTDSIITLNIYSGGDTNPETLIGTETITLNGTYGWREVFLSMPIEFNPAQNLWITLTATGRAEVMFMSGQDAGINGRWFLNGSDWVDIGTLYYLNYKRRCFAIRGFVETNDYSTWNWTTESGVASPFTITGLEAETDYAVRVKSNCGQDCESGWTWAYFTTLSACDTPFDLEATNITCNSATLNWTGYQDSYNLKYRHRVDDPNTPATIILEAHNVWGNGTGYQMLLDADATALGNIIHPANGYLTYNCNIPEGLYDAFEYMIPANADASCTAVNVVVNNSVTIQIPAGTYDWCITRPVAGEGIRIAGNRGNIDARYDNYVFEPGVTYHFTMGLNLYGEGVTLEIIHNEWSDWTVVENITHPYSFTGLIPEAEYEWQVQGINADCEGGLTEWSEIATFTTPDMSVSTQTVELVSGWNWFSTYIEADDLLQQLEASLGENGLYIESSELLSTEYLDGEWLGDLEEVGITNEQMYLIQTSAACTIQLQGLKANPANHVITINPEWNWVGYLCSEEMTIAEALAGFVPEDGDQIESMEGYAEYLDGEWLGLETLKPGQGFLYYSNSATTKAFTFPASAK